MHPDFALVNFIPGIVTAIVFVLIMSAVKEPARQNFNAVIAAGLATTYANGGFGVWEYLYMAVAVFPAYFGLKSYKWIGVAWLLHSAWDLPHHFYGNIIWNWYPDSSFGCFVMDFLVAIWFFAGAPSVFDYFRSNQPNQKVPG